MTVFEELAAQGKLIGPGGAGPLQARDGRIVSADGREFGPVEGPLNLLPDFRATLEAGAVPGSDVERLRLQLGLADSAATRARIAEAIASTGIRFAKSHLSAEAHLLEGRFEMEDFAVRGKAAASSRWNWLGALRARLFPRATGGPAGLELVSHSIGARITADLRVFRSVRVRNTGCEALASGAPVQTYWTRGARHAAEEGVISTRLPVDIEAGREITLILALQPPRAAGTWRVHARLAGASEPFLAEDVEISDEALPTFGYEHHPQTLEYAADHHVAMLDLAGFLDERYPGRSAAILEIGGGVHPTGHAIAARGHRVVSADISHSQSILGTLYFREKMPQLDQVLGFLSCEGTSLPFAQGAFDGVVMFAAFHHFADPVGLLREARRVTGGDGFVYLGCDPCVPAPEDAQYRKELRRGINEQMWTLEEFAGFFRAAGLAPARARVDAGSLKVALLKA